MASCIEIGKAVKILATEKGFAWIDGGVLRIGTVPFQEQRVFDFATEQLQDSANYQPAPAQAPSVPLSPLELLKKHGGRRLAYVKGKIVVGNSLHDLLKKALVALEEIKPDLFP